MKPTNACPLLLRDSGVAANVTALIVVFLLGTTSSFVAAAPPVAGPDVYSPYPTGANTLAIPLGNGADGEVIAFNPVDQQIYHSSGNATVVFEKFPSTPPFVPVTGIILTGNPLGETFGLVWYPPIGKFLRTNNTGKLLTITADGICGPEIGTVFDLAQVPVAQSLRGLALVGTRIFGTSPFANKLMEIDPTNAQTLSDRVVVLDGGASISTGFAALTADPVTRTVYGIAKVSGVTGRLLIQVDVRSAQARTLGNTGRNFSSVTVLPDGTMFGAVGNGGGADAEKMFLFARPAAVATEESSQLSFGGLLANDTDPDLGDTLDTVPGSLLTSPLGAKFQIFAGGGFTYDPTGSATIQALAQDQLGLDTFSYTVKDQTGATATGSVTVQVLGLNDPPILDLDGAGGTVHFHAQPVILDAPAAVKVSDVDATITDVDATDKIFSLTATLSGALDGASEVLAATPSGGADTVVFVGNVLTVTATAGSAPAADFQAVLRSITFTDGAVAPTVGVRTVVVQASDGMESSAPATSTIVVTTRPVLTLPASPIVVDPDSKNGSVVTFTPTATDAEDGAITPVSVPASGTTFPIGDTVVTITATDSDGAAATGTITVTVAFVRPGTPALAVGVKAGPIVKKLPTGAPAPGAGGGGIPAGATIGTLFTPAISDIRDLAARATVLAGTKRFDAIYVEDRKGVGRIAAFVGKQADGFPVGVNFKNFRDPLLGPDQSVTFAAKVTSKTIKPTADEGVWTDVFGALAPVLTEGAQVPGLPVGVTLKSVLSLSPRAGELLALVKLNAKPPLVTAKNDTALLLLTAPAAATPLLRTGDSLGGPKVVSIAAFLPGMLTKGQGATHADTGVVARVKLDAGGDRLLVIRDDGNVTSLLSTAAIDPNLNAQATKIFLPATAGLATASRITAKLTPTGKPLDSVIFTATNAPFTHRISAGDPVPGGGATFTSFGDPVVSDAPRAVFAAKIAVAKKASAGLYAWSAAFAQSEIVRAGTAATNAAGGALPDTVWKSFTNYALPDGPGSGVIFTAEVTGKAVTAKNKLGLWAEDSAGTIRLLLRGDQDVTVAPGVTKKLTTFRLLDALPGSFGSRRSYNAVGSVAVLATFADKTQFLLRIDIP